MQWIVIIWQCIYAYLKKQQVHVNMKIKNEQFQISEKFIFLKAKKKKINLFMHIKKISRWLCMFSLKTSWKIT